MPMATKIISIVTFPKWSPATLCPAPSPGFQDPHWCLCWWLQAACSYTSRPVKQAFRWALQPVKGLEGSDGQHPVFCSSLLSLPPWPFLTICQELFKHWAMHSHKDAFHSPESRECLPWFPESQKQVQLLPLGLLFRFKDSFYPT